MLGQGYPYSLLIMQNWYLNDFYQHWHNLDEVKNEIFAFPLINLQFLEEGQPSMV